ncbi:MAG: hypothetical protein ABW252_24185 [Polyangiales bacterium]
MTATLQIADAASQDLHDRRERAIETLREHWLTDTDLSFLRSLEPDVLARIATEVERNHARVSASQRPLYEAMARATRFIPNFMVAKLGSNLSPYVKARICECLEPKAAAALSKAYEPAVLAEISLHLDAGLAAQIAALTELDALSAIVQVLLARGLWRRLGEISDALEPGLLEKLVQRIRDPERIAKVAAHMTAVDKLSRVVRRLDAKLQTAVIGALERHGPSAALSAISGP